MTKSIIDTRAVGIGLRAAHYAEIFERKPSLGFVEVHSENFFHAGGASMRLLARARAGESRDFKVNDDALVPAARTVAELTRQNFPALRIPYHSRWRHFEAGQVNRVAQLDDRLGLVSAAERARSQIDLALVSVLLDAGAGPAWRFHEAGSDQPFARSEGLGVASFHAFTSGLFSSDPAQPLRLPGRSLVLIRFPRGAPR